MHDLVQNSPWQEPSGLKETLAGQRTRPTDMCRMPHSQLRTWMEENPVWPVDQLADFDELVHRLCLEIRTPLAGIAASAEVLFKEATEEVDRRIVEELFRRIQRLDRTSHQLIHLVNLGISELEPLELSQVVDRSHASLEPLFTEKEVSVRTCHGEGAPLVEGIEWQLVRAVLNILTNAFEAVDKNGSLSVQTWWPGKKSSCSRPSCVCAELCSPQERLNLLIADSGSGVGVDSFRKIFTPFYTTKKGHEGLGLAEAFRIVQLHGGSIQVGSRPEEGFLIIMSFPLNNA